MTQRRNESYAELQEKIRQLEREKKSAIQEFRSELEEVIRAQHSLETMARLLSEISPSLFATRDKGEELLSDLDGALYKARQALNAEWYGMGIGRKKDRPDIALAKWINDEVKKQNRQQDENSS